MPSAFFDFTPENPFHREPTPDTLVEVKGMVLNTLKSAAPFTVLFLAATFSTADVGTKTTRPQLEDWVAKLDADDPLEREAAGAAIRESNTDIKSIFEIMKRPTLSLEQRKRLENVAREPFEKSPRAGLGVSFDLSINDGSVRIIGTVDRPGFHAHEVLKPGDTVRELDGLVIRTQEQARSVILSHDPGDTLDVLVIRQGTPVRAAIKLGNFLDLDVGAPRNQLRQDFRGRSLDSAFQVRMLRELGDQVKQSGAAPIDAGFSAETWDGIYRKLQNTRNKRIERDGRVQLANVPVVNPAGVGRVAAVDVVNQPVKRINQHLNAQDRQWLNAALQQSRAMLQQRLNEIDKLKTELENPNLNADQQNRRRDELFDSIDIVGKLERQIREIEAQLNGR